MSTLNLQDLSASHRQSDGRALSAEATLGEQGTCGWSGEWSCSLGSEIWGEMSVLVCQALAACSSRVILRQNCPRSLATKLKDASKTF